MEKGRMREVGTGFSLNLEVKKNKNNNTVKMYKHTCIINQMTETKDAHYNF
jgi:hypothetical protein